MSDIVTAGVGKSRASQTPAARTAARSEPEARLPERAAGDPVAGGRLGDRGPILSRSGQPVSLRLMGDVDQFHIPPEIIPAGWTYEWKTKTVYNWEHVQHQVELGMNGWEPVPAERHDGLFMPKGYKGPIERGGQILMERDDRLTARSREIERERALEPIRNSRQMAGLMPRSDIVDFSHGEARRFTGVKTTRQPNVGSNAGYEYSIDE